jgi:hypothetical protein
MASISAVPWRHVTALAASDIPINELEGNPDREKSTGDSPERNAQENGDDRDGDQARMRARAGMT